MNYVRPTQCVYLMSYVACMRDLQGNVYAVSVLVAHEDDFQEDGTHTTFTLAEPVCGVERPVLHCVIGETIFFYLEDSLNGYRYHLESAMLATRKPANTSSMTCAS